MFRLMAKGAIVALAVAAHPGAAQALGPDAAACRPGSNRSAVLVTVDGFRERTGNVRVALYGSNPATFLERGQTVRRVDVPVTRRGRRTDEALDVLSMTHP